MPRSEDGNQDAMTRVQPGPTGASATPSRKRKASSSGTTIPMKCTRPMQMVKMDQITMARARVFFEPKRSLNQPEGIRKIT
ncbi:hypothetical protein D3C80_2008020 [compost metagenome]